MEIILRTPAKRLHGDSRSGKALVLLTKGYGGKFYSIPKWAIISQRRFEKPINDVVKMPYIEIKFKAKAANGSHPVAIDLNMAIDQLEKHSTETTILR